MRGCPEALRKDISWKRECSIKFLFFYNFGIKQRKLKENLQIGVNQVKIYFKINCSQVLMRSVPLSANGKCTHTYTGGLFFKVCGNLSINKLTLREE
jgi:hypothetical protein